MRWFVGLGLVSIVVAGCVEYGVGAEPPPPPADPPGDSLDVFGDPPDDWDSCYAGLHGYYFNFDTTHPDVIQRLDPEVEPDPVVLADADWWDDRYRSFRRFDASIDFGSNWWPVDDGMVEDPQYFAVRWVGWLRVYNGNSHPAVFGAATDAWVLINDEVVLSEPTTDAFEPGSYDISAGTGVYRIDVRYAHRAGLGNGFRFRFADDRVKLCYPDYSRWENAEE